MPLPHASRSTKRGDGVKVVASGGIRKSVWLVAGALGLASLAVLVLLEAIGGPRAAPPSALPPERLEAPPAADRDAPEASRETRRARRIEKQATATPAAPEVSLPPAPDAPPAREDAPFSFGPPGEKTGMALFPSRDTKPIQVGIVVPEDFEVPEGYVRHVQVDDDGEALPPILLFHPDYEWIDGAGNRIELPPDRVVPPELAPPGLPIELLVPPPKHEGAR